MALRYALGLGVTSIRAKAAAATTQEISSRLLLLSLMRINHNQSSNRIFFYNHHRQCHHLPGEPAIEFNNEGLLIRPPKPFTRSNKKETERYVGDSARFAINFHNEKENAELEFVRVLKVEYVPVGGVILYMTLEANNAGKSEFYHAEVFFRPWTNYRRIRKWERIEGPPPSVTK